MFTTIQTELSQGVAILRFNRPDCLNSFNVTMHQEVQHALKDWSQDAAVRVIVIRGNGRAFSAGQDLKNAPDNWHTFLYPQKAHWPNIIILWLS